MRPNRIHLVLTASLLAGGLGFAAGSLPGAEAHPPGLARGLTKGMVTKIAKKQAAKAVRKAAPGLSVAHAGAADHAADTDRVGGRTMRAGGARLASGGTPVTLAAVPGLTVVAACAGGNPMLTADVPGGGSLYLVGRTTSSILNNSTQYPLSNGTEGLATFVFTPKTGGDPVSGRVSWLWAPIENNCVFAADVVVG